MTTTDPHDAEPTTTISVVKLEELLHRLEMDSGIIDLLPDAVVVVREDGTIVRTNAQATALFGYRTEEFATMVVDDLVPAAVRDGHPTHRRAYHAAPALRRMGGGRVLKGLRRDGQEVEVEIMLNTIRTALGLLTIAVVRPRD